MKPNKKAQMITFDFSSSIVIFMIFIAIFIGLFLLSQTVEKKQDFELEYVFANLENNLKFGPSDRDFFSDYRVDKVKLQNFISTIGTGSIDSYVIGNVDDVNGVSHGIGLDEASYDVCLYFTDNDNSKVFLDSSNSIQALGWLETDPGSHTGNTCNSQLSSNNLVVKNPCEKYKQAISLFKPVLFDEGGPDANNRILQMNIVVCKR
jgi:hypothetical protein